MENMELMDSVGLIVIDLKKAKMLLDEVQSEYLTDEPTAKLDAVQMEDFKERLAVEFHRYSTVVDILGDYLENIDKGLGRVLGELEDDQ